VRLARFNHGREHETVARHKGGWVSLSAAPGHQDPARLSDLVTGARAGELEALISSLPELDEQHVRLAGAATVAGAGDDVWGAGLNYLGHSEDLAAPQPTTGPGSYLRPRGSVIDNGQPVELPTQSDRVTAEAELGLVIGPVCKNVARAQWRSVVVGITAVLDLTAEDVIRRNPRYIPWAKGFDTFCSVGPELVTLDEFTDADLAALQVSTVRNGETVATAPVSGMRYDLGFLVEYFTAGRTLGPGTVICTGTPGAAVINSGDTIRAEVEGVGHLEHPVR
jgi:2-keto-4-pentenoate hydratase/2-oxohepta-3-ene-1,7-dioic acid hydratase in catechol pathway